MLPFIHIGSLQFASYGVCMVTGFFIGYYILRAELGRRNIGSINAIEIVFVLALCAMLSSKLYFVLQHAELVLHEPAALFQRNGFTYYGGLLGDLAALVYLSRRYRVPMLTLCDSLSAACALGYGIGRIGCFLAGDGDYGITTALPWGMSYPNGLVPTLQRVHPTELYEFLTSAVIARWLWRRGASPRVPAGGVFALFLISTGLARFLVEFIKRNPRLTLGLTNAQIVAAISVAAGLAIYWMLRSRQTHAPRTAVQGAHPISLQLPGTKYTEPS